MKLVCSNDRFEYDTYLLVKEFWPKEEIERQTAGSDALFEVPGAPGDGAVLTCLYDMRRTVVSFEWAVGSVRETTESRKEEKTKEEGKTSDEEKEILEEGTVGPGAAVSYEYPVDEGLSEKEYKNAHMRNLYRGLSAITGQNLPWGNLTGVRPVKPARQMVLAGATDEEVLKFYKETRFVSDGKSLLALEIAKREAGILSRLDPVKGYSLYIGIPFCPTRCLYCSFLSGPIAKWQNRVDEYLSCIEKELAFTKEAFAGRKIDTIYIGGGTPTALSADELKVLMNLVNGFLSDEDRKNLLEFTVEAGRPDSITREKLKVLKEAGVSRISVNPQTMNEETLKRIGRAHSVEETVKAFLLAREEGFDNINMDLILGLPGEGIREVEHTLAEVEKLAPDSLTVHSLAIKRSALMKDWLREQASLNTSSEDKNSEHKGEESEEENGPVSETAGKPANALAGHDIMTGMAAAAYASAARQDLKPYYLYRQKNIAGNLENVGFAKEGKYGIYNILMMEEVQSIVAIGAGTVSKRVLSEKEISRCDTAKDIGLYMDGIDEMIRRKEELFC